MTQPEPAERPRTWIPLIVAGVIAVLVVGGAMLSHLVRSDLTPEKRSAADACEAQYKVKYPSGPGIVGGDIYSASEWRELDAALVRLGAQPEQTLTGEQADAKDDEVAALVSGGGDTMTVIWQRDDESHAKCMAEMKGGSVTLVTITQLDTSDVSAAPTPSS